MKIEIEETYNCKIASFAMDNSRNMNKMRKEIGRDDIITYGCSTNYTNLLAGDFEDIDCCK